MRWKWVVSIGVFLIIALAATVYIILDSYDYNKLKPQISQMIMEGTGRVLNMHGAINLGIGFPTALEVEDVTLANASWGTQPEMIKIKQLQARVRLLPLLFGDVKLKQISLAGVEALLETNSTGSGNWDFTAVERLNKKAGAFKVLSIDIDDIHAENLAITFRNGESGSVAQFNVAGLEVAKQGQLDSLALHLRADYNKQAVEFSGKIGSINLLFAHERFPLELSGQFSDAKVKIDGGIDDVLDLNGIDLQVSASGTNLAALDPGTGTKLPETDTFEVNGRLKGSAETLRLEGVRGNLSGSGVELTFSGNVGDLIALSEIDLACHGTGKDLAKIGQIIGEKLPVTDKISIQGRLRGSTKALSFQDVRGRMRRSSLHLDFDGEIKELSALTGIDLQLRGTGRNLSNLKPIIGRKLPETGAFNVQGRLTGSTNALSFQEAQGSVQRGTLTLDLDGEIRDLINFSGINVALKGSGNDLAELAPLIGVNLPETDAFTFEGRLAGSALKLGLQKAKTRVSRGGLRLSIEGGIKELATLSGMDLKFEGSGKDLAKAGPIIGRELPKTDAFSIQGRLTGSPKVLFLRQTRGHARRGTLNLDLTGEIKDLTALRGMDLELKGSGKDLTQVGPIIGRDLPKTNAFNIQGRLTGSAKALSLRQTRGHARRGTLNLDLTGDIKDLAALRGMDLELKSSGKDLAQVGPIIGHKLPATDEFSVQARLMGSAKAFSLQKIQGHAGRGGLKLSLQGGIKDLLSIRGLDLKLKASGKELAEIGPLINIKLPAAGPFVMSGHLSGSTQAISLHGISAIIDRSDFNGFAFVEFRKRPKITLRLASAVIDFTTLMKRLEKEEQGLGRSVKGARRLFPEDPLPFDTLKKVDVDIELKARNIHARDARFEFGNLTLTLIDSNLDIDTLEATYKLMKIKGNLHVRPDSPPQVVTKFLVQNFDLGALLKELGADDQVQAHIDIAVDVKSKGDSVQTLMANLDGSMGAVMGKGFLTEYLDLISMDLSRKVIPYWGRHKKAGNINCAVVQFDIESGVATSRAFVFDTQLGILTGEGTINLGTEAVKFLLVPKPKNPSLISLSTKLRVTGSIMDPKVNPDMLSLAAKGAKFLSALAIGPLGLLAPFVSLGAHQKHPCEVRDMAQKVDGKQISSLPNPVRR